MSEIKCECGKAKRSSIGGLHLESGQFLCGGCVVRYCETASKQFAKEANEVFCKTGVGKKKRNKKERK